jgi:hypothetical protein
MPGYLVIVFSLSFAFMLVQVLHIPKKPLNCVKCLTAWISFFMALGFHTPYFYFYLGLGFFAGSMFEGIKMRYL